jgi:anaerobic magnesium-protoporphyrin IX monomethyl ester cyclase
VGFFLQFGSPGETRADIDMTLRMVKECHPDDIGMSVSYPLPGTRFHENIKMQLGAKQNWVDSADLAMMYQGPFATGFYRQLHNVLHKRFRWQRSIREAKTLVRVPWRWPRSSMRRLIGSTLRLVTLPIDLIRLNRLAATPVDGVLPLPHMTYKQAAMPTAQED